LSTETVEVNAQNPKEFPCWNVVIMGDHTMLEKMRKWKPPDDWQRITTIDAHTGGEPFRIITGGLPELEGDTILAAPALYDRPPGPPANRADVGTPRARRHVRLRHHATGDARGGHRRPVSCTTRATVPCAATGSSAVTTVAIETGMIAAVEPVTTVRIDAPAGLVTAHARLEKGRVKSVLLPQRACLCAGHGSDGR
jgi:proline racemase